MQQIMNDVIQDFEKVGICPNPTKCSWIADKHSLPYDGGYHGRYLTVNNTLIAQTDKIKVLGSVICCDRTEQEPVLHRISSLNPFLESLP